MKYTTTHTRRHTRRCILPGDRVLVWDAFYGMYIWHRVADVMLGERTKVRIEGATDYFDENLVIHHERRAQR